MRMESQSQSQSRGEDAKASFVRGMNGRLQVYQSVSPRLVSS